MPDWIHSLLYLVIFSATLIVLFLLTRDILGFLAGLIAGHFLASFLVSRLPGFWGKK